MTTIRLYEDNCGGLWMARAGVVGTKAARVGADVAGGPFADDAEAMAHGWDEAWTTDFLPLADVVDPIDVNSARLVAEWTDGEVTTYAQRCGAEACRYLGIEVAS